MGVIEHWQPNKGLSQTHRLVLQHASLNIHKEDFNLDESEIESLRSAVQSRADEWKDLVTEESTNTIVEWVKVVTLAEKKLPNCETGGKSPVLALLAVLKQRNEVPSELLQWIKANTENRYLPYGDLMDRL